MFPLSAIHASIVIVIFYVIELSKISNVWVKIVTSKYTQSLVFLKLAWTLNYPLYGLFTIHSCDCYWYLKN